MRQAIKIWVLLLSLMDSLLRLYWHKMGLWFPSKRFLMYSQEEPDISWLPLFVQLILQPYLMKIILCSLLAFLPLLLLCCVRRRPPLREFVIWFDPHPPNRTELGEAAYFLERPYLPLRDHHDHLARASTGCIPQSSSPPSLRSTKSAQ
ncbi:uncharacterized protein [Periplaneta americana]|uniref:uncharacterized protein n=1 Tax=Periplaneta americana TaxID=6978 RepID=UPI0037E70931